MKEALKEASKALEKGEVPVGAVIVKNGKIIGRGHNEVESLKDPTKHAEMTAIQNACKEISSWRLTGATIYVTLEPCAMCAGAILLSRMEGIVIGTMDKKAGCVGSLMNILDDDRLNHKVKIEAGLLQKECEKTLKDFFKELRKERKKI